MSTAVLTIDSLSVGHKTPHPACSGRRAGHRDDQISDADWGLPNAFEKFVGMPVDLVTQRLLFAERTALPASPSAILWTVTNPAIAQSRIRPSPVMDILARPDSVRGDQEWIPQTRTDFAIVAAMGRRIRPQVTPRGEIVGAVVEDGRTWPTTADLVAVIETTLGYRPTEAGYWRLKLVPTSQGGLHLQPASWWAPGALIVCAGRDSLRIADVAVDRRSLMDPQLGAAILRDLVQRGIDAVRTVGLHQEGHDTVRGYHQIGILPAGRRHLAMVEFPAIHRPVAVGSDCSPTPELVAWHRRHVAAGIRS